MHWVGQKECLIVVAITLSTANQHNHNFCHTGIYTSVLEDIHMQLAHVALFV